MLLHTSSCEKTWSNCATCNGTPGVLFASDVNQCTVKGGEHSSPHTKIPFSKQYVHNTSCIHTYKYTTEWYGCEHISYVVILKLPGVKQNDNQTLKKSSLS